ncbi:MAG: polysaccharide biosynthesis C-terminal domain-containing protein, partial [Terrisporobacter sp.]
MIITVIGILLCNTILNIILDIVFIINFNMGVEGVAIATTIAQGVSFICSVVYLNKKHKVLKAKFRGLKFDKDI